MRRHIVTTVAAIGLLGLGLILPDSGHANRDHGEHHRGAPYLLFEKHAERLRLDAKTLEQIHTISEATKEQSNELRTNLQQARTTMRELLSAENPDKAAVMKQAEIMGAIKTDLRKQRLATMLEIRALLTPEQRQELIEIVKEFRSKRRPQGTPHEGPR